MYLEGFPSSENVGPENQESQRVVVNCCWSAWVGEQSPSQSHPRGGSGRVSRSRLEAFLQIRKMMLWGRGWV